MFPETECNQSDMINTGGAICRDKFIDKYFKMDLRFLGAFFATSNLLSLGRKKDAKKWF